MIDSIQSSINTFLKAHLDPQKPILLGLSGGADSLTLLHTLIHYQKVIRFELHVAHIDHGWREESALEAAALKGIVEKLNLPFHSMRIAKGAIQGNLEAACRTERFCFFASLCNQFSCQAVILGHHADDQAETVLKRVLEGKSLPYLAGMHPVSRHNEMMIWRPLLGIDKKDILAWIEKKGFTPFNDCTNNDTTFLRARFRHKILPWLTQEFGKEINRSLQFLGSEAQELQTYFDDRLEVIFGKLQRGALGTFLDLSTDLPSAKIEIKYLLRKVCAKEDFFLSKEMIETMAELLMQNTANRQFQMGKHTLFIDRRRLFISHHPFPHLSAKKSLIMGTFTYGSWEITASPVIDSSPSQTQPISWADIWHGKFQVQVPMADYHIGPALPQAYYQKTENQQCTINNWWTNHCVPAFFRPLAPVLWVENTITHEFLTGKGCRTPNKSDSQLLLIFQLMK